MMQRPLGKGGLLVSRMGLGCMGMSEFYGPGDERESIGRSTAPGAGDEFSRHGGYLRAGQQRGVGRKGDPGSSGESGPCDEVRKRSGEGRTWLGVSGKPDYVRACCEDSLRRLGVDTIDLYYQHRVDPDTPIEDTIEAMADLVRQGKVRHLGLSEAAPATIRRACSVHPIAALQTEYSLWTRDPEVEVLPTCRELGVGFVAYSPLGRGIFGGRIKSLNDLAEGDYRRNAPRFAGENLSSNLPLVKRLEEIASGKKCSPGPDRSGLAACPWRGRVPHSGTKRGRRWRRMPEPWKWC